MRYDFTVMNASGKLMEIGSNESSYTDALVDLCNVLYHYGFTVDNLRPFYCFTNKYGKVSRRKITADKLLFVKNQLSILSLTLGDSREKIL